MAFSPISREVEQFIHDHISTVGQLEALLFLNAHADREWSATQLSQALYCPPDLAAAWLSDLRRAGLLTVREEAGREEAERLYRYNPGTRTLDHTVKNLGRAYTERKDAVIHLIFSGPSESIRSFADAFRIRKED